jgi:hypothetical protein
LPKDFSIYKFGIQFVGLVIPFMEKFDWIGFLNDPSRKSNFGITRP